MYVEDHYDDESVHLSHSITQAWLEAVLRRHYSRGGMFPFVTINNYTCTEEYNQLKSFKSNIVAVTIDANVGNDRVTHHFILKMLPLEPFFRSEVSSGKYDLREINFYTMIQEDLNRFQRQQIRDSGNFIRMPTLKCYFAKYIPPNIFRTRHLNMSTEESVVVMENLKRQNFVTVKYTKGLSPRQVRSAFEALSRIHALTLCMRAKTGDSLSERYNFLFRIEEESAQYVALIERGLPILVRFLSKFRGTEGLIQRLWDLRIDLQLAIETLIKPDEPISVLAHSNFWINNLLFRGSECVILDWQMITCGRPTNDLAFLLATSVKTRTRRRYTRKFLDFYYNNLALHVRKLGFDIEKDLKFLRAQVTADYRRSQLLALLLCISSIDIIMESWQTKLRFLDFLIDLDRSRTISTGIVRLPRLSF